MQFDPCEAPAESGQRTEVISFPDNAPSDEGASETVVLPVRGMSCVGCARSIERELDRVQGVEAALVNLRTIRYV